MNNVCTVSAPWGGNPKVMMVCSRNHWRLNGFTIHHFWVFLGSGVQYTQGRALHVPIRKVPAGRIARSDKEHLGTLGVELSKNVNQLGEGRQG